MFMSSYCMSEIKERKEDYIFQGRIEHFSSKAGGIHVDWFDYNDFQFQYFLSHAHTDHFGFQDKGEYGRSQKIGLFSPKFISELERNPNVKIYCTEITRNIIEKYSLDKGFDFDEVDNHIAILEVDKENKINLIDENGERSEEEIFVTPIRANHIPGSVMFLFEDSIPIRVLYTGDFRYCTDEKNEEMETLIKFVADLKHNNKVIDHLYVDITCLDIGKLYHPDQNKLPTRKESKDMVRELIETHQPKHIHIDADMIGSEDMVNAAAKFTNNTSEEVLSRLDDSCSRKEQLKYLLEGKTDPSSRLVHLGKSELHILHYPIFDEKCQRCVKDPALRIRATLQKIFRRNKTYSYSNRETWKNYDEHGNYWQVLYSHHSSDAEIRNFLSQLRYKKVYPINEPLTRYLEETGSRKSQNSKQRHYYIGRSLCYTLGRYGGKLRILWYSQYFSYRAARLLSTFLSEATKPEVPRQYLNSDKRFEVIIMNFRDYAEVVMKVGEHSQYHQPDFIVIPCCPNLNVRPFIQHLTGNITACTGQGTIPLLFYSTRNESSSTWAQEIDPEYLADIRALASARGSVATRRVATGPRARRARGHRARPLGGPKGPRVAKTCESEGPKGPRTSKAKCPSRRLPVLLYVFHNSAQNREIHGPFSRP